VPRSLEALNGHRTLRLVPFSRASPACQQAGSGLFLHRQLDSFSASNRLRRNKNAGGVRTPAELEDSPQSGRRIRRVSATMHKACALYGHHKGSQGFLHTFPTRISLHAKQSRHTRWPSAYCHTTTTSNNVR